MAFDKDGYEVVKINGEKKRLHRYVMEQYLGRKLLPSEVVHHKDENKTNNNIDNLIITSHIAHNHLHNPKLPLPESRKCNKCLQVKPRSEFYIVYQRNRNRTIVYSKCKQCEKSRITVQRRNKKSRKTLNSIFSLF